MRCTSKAPAKIILLGEHWVVHGGYALASSLGLYCSAIGTYYPSIRVVVYSSRLKLTDTIYPSQKCKTLCNLARMIDYIASTLRRTPWPANIVIESEIPPGTGLGSSASTAVAVAATYFCIGGLDPSLEEVSRAAYEAEKVVHGNPSGIDNTIATYGGIILYSRTTGFKKLGKLNFPEARILIVDTGIERSTKNAVEKFTRRLTRLKQIANQLIEVQNNIVMEAVSAIKNKDIVYLGYLLDTAQGLLNSMGVSHPEIERIVHIARAKGALGAKLTGAGMGGSVIVLAEAQRVEKIKQTMEQLGYTTYVAEIGVEGVKIARETKTPL